MTVQAERVSGASGVVELSDSDRTELARLVRADPLVNAVLDSRLSELIPLGSRRFGGPVFGVRDDTGRLTAAAFSGGNLLPAGGGPAEWRLLAQHVAERRRVATSIVGQSDATRAMWDVLEPVWGPARAVRADQPLLSLDRAVARRSAAAPDSGVRRASPSEIEKYLPAAAAMFTEELGVSPLTGLHAEGYRRRIMGLLRTGHAFCVTDRAGDVVFKADLGVVTPRTCQIQGVWVRPDRRGQGLGTAAMVAVLDHALAAAPTASLYVNDFNIPARRMYAALGMTEAARLATVLL